MCIWQEAVKKETQHQKIYENFTINPSKCKQQLILGNSIYIVGEAK
jgi:hypothetical protein